MESESQNERYDSIQLVGENMKKASENAHPFFRALLNVRNDFPPAWNEIY